MLYLKLSRNQEQEWSSVTVSSLAKKLVGVNNIVIENVELEATSVGEQIVIRARPRKNAQCRCGVCGRKCSRFDHGKGLRRWRAPDLGAGTMIFIEAEAPRVNCPEHGVVVQQVPWARRIGSRRICGSSSSYLSRKSARQLRSGEGGRGHAGYHSL